ncbi:MAG: class I SAM-dependent methyltransferase [Candidatus Latescibacterota bacterium]
MRTVRCVRRRQRGSYRAREAATASPHGDRLEYDCGDAVSYDFNPGSFDLAACINATNMFGEGEFVVSDAIRHMRQAIHEEGCLLIGQPYFTIPDVPQELIDYEGVADRSPDPGFHP